MPQDRALAAVLRRAPASLEVSSSLDSIALQSAPHLSPLAGALGMGAVVLGGALGFVGAMLLLVWLGLGVWSWSAEVLGPVLSSILIALYLLVAAFLGTQPPQLLYGLHQVLFHEQLTLRGQALYLKRGPWQEQRIALASVAAVEGPPLRLVLHGGSTVALGGGMDADERAWVADLLRAALAAQRPDLGSAAEVPAALRVLRGEDRQPP